MKNYVVKSKNGDYNIKADSIFDAFDTAFKNNMKVCADIIIVDKLSAAQYQLVDGCIIETNPGTSRSYTVDSDGERIPYFGFKSTDELIEEYTDYGAMGKEMDCSQLYFDRLCEEIALRDYYESFKTEPVECSDSVGQFEAFKIETDELPF